MSNPSNPTTNPEQSTATTPPPDTKDVGQGKVSSSSEGEQKDTVTRFKEATDQVIGGKKEAESGSKEEAESGSKEEAESGSKEEAESGSKEEAESGSKEEAESASKEEAKGEPQEPQNPQMSQKDIETHADPSELTASQKKSSKLAATLSMAGAPVFVESDNVIDLIIEDHSKARKLYKEYKRTEARNEKKTVVNELIKALVSHDECEQLLVYPLLKEKMGDTKEAARVYEKSLGEHQDHRELLYQVKHIDINTEFEKFDSKLKEAMDSVVDHVEEEESYVLPLIQKNLTEEELKKVGASFRAHKPFCVTRPHPSAPQTGFPAALGNMTLKPFDAMKDFTEA